MKKIKLFTIGLASLMITGVASAQQLTGGSNDFTMVNCSLLANDVEIMLSGGVVGGINCDDTNGLIGLSVCHSSGLTAERSTAYNDGEIMSDGTACAEATVGEGCIETVTGSAFPSAHTGQGTVSSRFPGNACSAGNAETLAGTVVTDAIAAGY